MSEPWKMNRKLVESMLEKNLKGKLGGSMNSTIAENLLMSWLELEAELAKYKREAEKIPDFCYYHNIDGGCNILECTMSICPKYREEVEGE
jgi:hypothetical protein